MDANRMGETSEQNARLYKNKVIYKWEDSAGLAHHCGTCATPLHNARAKTKCLGTHVEPCHRFHGQLHFVGKAHECMACRNSDEIHHQRHKGIFELVVAIKEIDGVSLPIVFLAAKTVHNLVAIKSIAPTEEESSGWETESTLTESTLAESTDTTNENMFTKSERKKAKKARQGEKARASMSIISQYQLDVISEILHGAVYDSKGAVPGRYKYKMPTFESPKQEATSSDLLTPIKNTTTARKRKVKKLMIDGSRLRTNKFVPNKTLYTDFPQLKRILDDFQIDPAKTGNDVVRRRSCVKELEQAICHDIEITAREAEEAEINEAAFWKWAGKRAWHTIMQTRTTLDWATCAKIVGEGRRSLLYDVVDAENEPEFDFDRETEELDLPETISPLTLKEETVQYGYSASELDHRHVNHIEAVSQKDLASQIPSKDQSTSVYEDFAVKPASTLVDKLHKTTRSGHTGARGPPILVLKLDSSSDKLASKQKNKNTKEEQFQIVKSRNSSRLAQSKASNARDGTIDPAARQRLLLNEEGEDDALLWQTVGQSRKMN